MQFYVMENGSFVEKRANLLAVAEDVKDETLDTAQVQLMFCEEDGAFAPRTLCKMVLDGDTLYYHIATDNVSVQTITPRTYKHKLTLVQTTRKLSHYLLPNMVITKPREGAKKTYFTNANQLNNAFYSQSFSAQPSGFASWKGFVTNVIGSNGISTRGQAPSPYWGECLALSSHDKAKQAVIHVSWNAIVCKATYNSDYSINSVSAKETILNRALAYPDWLNVYLVVYWTSKNVNRIEWDTELTDKEIISKHDIDEVQWGKDGGTIVLNDGEVGKINAHDDGYIMCELVSEVSGTIPTELYNSTYNRYLTEVYDRLFIDESEFTENGIQAVFSNVSLELRYEETYLYDVLKKIIARQQSRYSKGNSKPLFYLPTSGEDYETLTNTPSPEFTFVGCTVFEAVSQVLETIDALPRFDCDDEGKLTLALDYINEVSGTVPSITKFTSYISNSTEQKRDNQIVSLFRNGENLCTFPNKGKKGALSFAPCSVKQYGVPEYADFCLKVDKPIKYINHLWVKVPTTVSVVYKGKNADGTDKTQTWGDVVFYRKDAETNLNIDFASFVFDDNTYSSALDQGSDYPSGYNHNIRMQMNCLRFKKGSKTIDIGIRGKTSWNEWYSVFWNCLDISIDRKIGRYGQNYASSSIVGTGLWRIVFNKPTKNNFYEVFYSVEYASDINGRLAVESPYPKEEGQFTASASGSSLDIGKLGLNMLGIILKSGEPTMTCSQMLTSWADRIKVGSEYYYDGAYWIATKCSYGLITATESENIIKGTIEFTKNFNGLSKRIAIDQSKRFTNIDTDITNLCETNIVNYVYFVPCISVAKITPWASLAMEDCVFNNNNVARIIAKAFAYDESGYDEVGYARYSVYPRSDDMPKDIFIPLAIYGSGNSICFETKFDSAISAGLSLTASDGSGKWWQAWQNAINSKYYYGSDVKYTDEEGYAYAMTIEYVSKGDGGFGQEFPYIPNSSGSVLGKLENLRFDKMPNEIFGVNMQLVCLSLYQTSDKQVLFGKRFFDTWNDNIDTNCPKYRFRMRTNGVRYRITDKKDEGSYLELSNIGVSAYKDDTYGYQYFLRFQTDKLATRNATYGITGFSITDDEDNILIASNFIGTITDIKGKATTLPMLHLFCKTKRL